MLSEAIRRRSRGEDVVVGVVEAHGRARTADLAAQLEQLPRKESDTKGTIFHELDLGLGPRARGGAGGRAGAHQH